MSTLAQFLGSGIKSIQRGTLSVTGGSTATATITAVVTSKTELRQLGSTNGGYVVLTNSTTITGTAPSSSTVISWELTERF